jgi:hypothetical protein
MINLLSSTLYANRHGHMERLGLPDFLSIPFNHLQKFTSCFRHLRSLLGYGHSIQYLWLYGARISPVYRDFRHVPQEE